MDEARRAPAGSGEAVPHAPYGTRSMVSAFWTSPVRSTIVLLAAGVVVVLLATVAAQLWLNAWNKPFFDAVAARDSAAFVGQLQLFLVIAGCLLALNVAQGWLAAMLKLKLREGLARDLFGEWLAPGRAFRLAHAGEIGVNPDQRLHEDARHLTEVSTDLGIGLLQAGLLLVGFVQVLWSLSGSLDVALLGTTLTIPGYMVWAAVLYAASASLVSARVGRRLIALNMERYGREAELRAALMETGDHIEAIAPARGEPVEEARLLAALGRILAVGRRLAFAQSRLTWITAGYGWSLIVVPVLVAAPVYFGGAMTFGGLMMAVGAFNQVQSSLRWFIDNAGVIADWRATFLRVADLRVAIRAMDDADGRTCIERVEGAPGKVVLDDLVVEGRTVATRLEPPTVEIAAGDRILLLGEPGVGKTLVFNALAGLWPFGRGRIVAPASARFMFVAARAYLPTGTLAAVIAYPESKDGFSRADMVAALSDMGQERLVPLLDREDRWDRELGDEDRDRLAFVRIAVHRPDWVVVDELFDELDAEGRRRALALLERLPGTTAILIGRAGGQEASFDRVVALVSARTG